MKILMANFNWIGGLANHLSRGFEKQGVEVEHLLFQTKRGIASKWFKLHQLKKIDQIWIKRDWEEFNKQIQDKAKSIRPDIFLCINEGYVTTDTIKYLKEKLNCRIVIYIVDNPFDSYRFSFLALSLKYADVIFVADRCWISEIKNVSPNSKIEKLLVGYSSDVFYPVNNKDITLEELQILSCDISFTGESYGMRSEGSYRSCILEQLQRYNLKIWGDENWKQKMPYQPFLKKAYKGERLSYDLLRKLYHLSLINMNIPSPQILTSFQPRLFEIGAVKGFQLVDHRAEVRELFTEDEVVTFKNIPDLLDKTAYYLDHEKERRQIADCFYQKIAGVHTWDNRANEMMDIINSI